MTFNDDAAEFNRAARDFGHELAKALHLYALLAWLTRRIERWTAR